MFIWGIRIVVVFGWTSIKISTRKAFRRNLAVSWSWFPCWMNSVVLQKKGNCRAASGSFKQKFHHSKRGLSSLLINAWNSLSSDHNYNSWIDLLEETTLSSLVFSLDANPNSRLVNLNICATDLSLYQIVVISEVRKHNDGVCNWTFKCPYVTGMLSNKVLPAKITYQIFPYWAKAGSIK